MRFKHGQSALIALCVSSLLGGCSVGPDYKKPEITMNAIYMNAKTDERESHLAWWQRFNDPVLNQLIKDAQQQNITLKMASRRIQMAQNYHKIVESYKLPTMSLGLGYYNVQISENTPLLGDATSPISVPTSLQSVLGESISLVDSQQDGWLAGLSVSWEADLFGRIDRQVEAARIREEQAVIFQHGMVNLITADVIHNYLQLLGTQERKQLIEESIDDQQSIVNLVEKVVSSGFGSQLDLARSKAMLAATQSLLPQLEIAEQVHIHRISILLAERLSETENRFKELRELPLIEGIIPTGLPSDLLTRRSDIKLAEREMAAINEEVGIAVAAQYPKFFLTGTPGLSVSNFDEFFTSGSFGWMASAGIHWNIFDAGRGEAAVAFNEARFNKAALNYQNTVDSAIKEVDSLLFAYGRSQQNQLSVDEAETATEKAVTKAKSLYKAGLVDNLSVLDAQRQLIVMRDRQVQAKLQTATVTVSIYKALGGDWLKED